VATTYLQPDTNNNLRRPLAWLVVGAGLSAAAGVATALVGTAVSLVALAALLGGLAAVLYPRLAAVVFAFALYMNVPVVAMTFHGVPSPVAIGSFLLLAIPAAVRIVRGDGILVPAVFVAMLAYLAVLLISTAASVLPEAALSWTMIYVTEGIVLTVLIVNAIRTKAELRAFLWAILLAGGVMGGLSIHQELTGSYDTNYLGFAQLHERGFTVEEDLVGKQVRPRSTGPIGEQNRYAQVLSVLLPLAFFQFKSSSRTAGRVAAAGLGLLATAGVLLTYSRMGLVAIVGVVVLLLIWRYVKFKHVFLAGLLGLVIVVAVAPDWAVRLESFAGVSSIVEDDPADADGAIRGRLTANIGAWRTFTQHPLIGVGPDVYHLEYSGPNSLYAGLRSYSASQDRQAHNLYLHIAADTGLLGLGAFLAIVFGTLWLLWKRRSELLAAGDPGALVLTGLVAAILVFLGTGMFLHMGYERYFWTLIGLASAGLIAYSATPVGRAVIARTSSP
jgi:putative inorganic carbon (hco3(-)) transporter